MLRLTVPTGRRLEDTCSAWSLREQKAMSALPWRAWVSRLPDHAIGHAILRALRADGVDVSAVKSVPASSERVGTYFIEYASPPRGH
jgi:sugar/nucleoside kinase (ribokinase family)